MKHPVNIKTHEQRPRSQRIADAIMAFCGTMAFVYIHAIGFALWIVTRGFGADPFPFNFLTMAVSLEAIFLSTFILISQNVSSARDRLTLEHDAEETDELLTIQRTQVDTLNAIKAETALLAEIREKLA